MSKRAFLKTLAFGAVGVMAAGQEKEREYPPELPPGVTRRRRPNRNGVWITTASNHTAEEWKGRLARMRTAGIDGVLFQVYDGAYAYWDTEAVPVEADRLGAFVPLAREAGLEVHAWFPMLPCRIERLLARNPAWRIEGHEHLDPAQAEVGRFLAGLVSELAGVPGITGVHADELRYPQRVAPSRERRQALTQLVNDHLARAAHARERSLTAAVMGGPTLARTHFAQDWTRWNVNAVFPKLFHDVHGADLAWIEAQAREAAAAVTVPVCAGLQASALGFSDMARAVRGALDGGVSGVALHSLEAMTEERWMGLQVVVVGQRPD